MVFIPPVIRSLINPRYLTELRKRIRRAQKSIIAVNYLADLSQGGVRTTKSDPVRAFSTDLIDAKRRGVEVHVILEGKKLDENYPFYKMMRDAGVDCWLDTSKTLIHQKACLIDNKILIFGSHNWTRASLEDSIEFSAVTDDPSTIQAFRSELKNVTRQQDDIRGQASKDTIDIPHSILSGIIAPLFKTHSMQSFDLYMILYRLDSGRPKPIEIDEKAWGAELGFDPAKTEKNITKEYRRYYYQQRINGVLYPLRDKFGLITIDRKNNTVTRRPLETKAKGFFLALPKTYWRYNWPRLLSFAAKYFYFISLAETKESPFYPWWSQSLSKLGRIYSCTYQNIALGARELADYNILERLRAIPKKTAAGYSSEADYYRINPFYDMNDFKRRLKNLEKNFPKKTVDLSIKTASLFWKTHDLGTLKTISSIIEVHGHNKVREASEKIAKTRTVSSRRSLDYLLWLLK